MRKFYTESPVIQYISIDQIKPSPFQPRVDYGNIEELAESIKNNRLREDPLVRPIEGDIPYEIVHGHRRIRALQYLGAPLIRCNVQEMDDKTAIEIALNENIQRKDLTPIEEGHAFKEYMERFDLSPRALARKIGKGKNVSYVNHRVRLLDLPEEIQDKVASGELTFSNVRAMLTLIDRKKDILSITKKILEGELEGIRQVKDTVEAVKSGVEIEDAVDIAKYRDFTRKRAKKIGEGKSVKEILEELQSHQTTSEELLEAEKRANLILVKDMLKQGLLVCPRCGESHLIWKCCGKELS